MVCSQRKYRSRRLTIVLAIWAISIYPQGNWAQGFNTEAIAAYAAKIFDRIDLDHDGRLTRMEHHVTRGGGFMSDYGLLDLDQDGIVTKREYIEAVRKYHAPHGPQKLI